MAKINIDCFRKLDGTYEIPVISLDFEKLQKKYYWNFQLSQLKVSLGKVSVSDRILATKIWEKCGDIRELDYVDCFF